MGDALLRLPSAVSLSAKRMNPNAPTRGFGVEKLSATFECYKDATDEWRWRLRHENGRIIADSGQSYTSHENALNGIRSVKANAPTAAVKELVAAR